MTEGGGDIVPLLWYQETIERYCHCGFCDSILPPMLLPFTWPAFKVECPECLTTGAIQFVELFQPK